MNTTLTGAVPLFQVFDMPASVAFYTGVLGFELYRSSEEIEAAEGRYFHWCWLRNGSAELMLNTAYDADERPPAPPQDRWAGHMDAGLSIGCADADELRKHLAERGWAPTHPNTANGMRSFSVSDPDGYVLGFVQHL